MEQPSGMASAGCDGGRDRGTRTGRREKKEWAEMGTLSRSSTFFNFAPRSSLGCGEQVQLNSIACLVLRSLGQLESRSAPRRLLDAGCHTAHYTNGSTALVSGLCWCLARLVGEVSSCYRASWLMLRGRGCVGCCFCCLTPSRPGSA